MRIDNIERDYRLGTFSNVDIGKRNGVSEAYIRKVAKKYDWVKGEPRKIKSPLPEAHKDAIKELLACIRLGFSAIDSKKPTPYL